MVILSQVEDFANFIVENSGGSLQVVVDGNKKFIFKAYEPMNYLVERFGIKLLQLGKDEALPNRYFYIARSNKKEELLKDENVLIEAYKTHGRFTILLVQDNKMHNE